MLKKQTLLRVVIFFAFHILLAIGMRVAPILATAHAYAILLIACLGALFFKKPFDVVCLSGYIAASEILWRMNRAPYLLWEQGKYALGLTMFISILRRGTRNPFLYLLYLLMLVPSALTIVTDDWGEFRRAVSFNLSGHFVLCLAFMFFSKIQLTREQLNKALLIMIAPLVGVCANITYYSRGTTSDIFNLHSSNRMSGGFGPNQVSAALGLGMFIAFIYVMNIPKNRYVKYIILVSALVLGAQSALTFSRGGLYNAIGAIVVASLFLIQNSKLRWNFILTVVFVGIAVQFAVLPKLNSFTQGKVFKRFQNTNTTGRAEIMHDDMKIFLNHPILGVGVGQAMYNREIFGETAAAHTEFTRLLAEHGVFGFFSLLMLFWICLKAFMKSKNAFQKAFSASCITWAFLYMANAAMRLALPSYIIGLSTVKLLPALKGKVIFQKTEKKPDSPDSPLGLPREKI